jgi:hypothetical protein
MATERDGELLKQEGIARTIEKEREEWIALYHREFSFFLQEQGDRPFLCGDFHEWFHARGNPASHHPNMWGALWHGLATSGVIRQTGVYRKATRALSHARVCAEWVRNGRD